MRLPGTNRRLYKLDGVGSLMLHLSECEGSTFKARNRHFNQVLHFKDKIGV